MDYLEKYSNQIDVERILESRKFGMKKASAPGMSEPRTAYENIPELHFSENDFSGDKVVFGTDSSLNSDEKSDLKGKLLQLSPWRKGPFEIGGIDLDAEWRSDFKWNRVLPSLEPLEGRRICDIGANSGYYMYRMLDQNPEFVLGLDPTIRYYYQFLALQLSLIHI